MELTLEAVNYYHKGLHLEYCVSPRSVSDFRLKGVSNSITPHEYFSAGVLPLDWKSLKSPESLLAFHELNFSLELVISTILKSLILIIILYTFLIMV